MFVILVDPLPPTPLHLPAKKNQKRYREAMHACEPSISPANQLRRWKRLVHLPDEGVDVLLTVTKVTTLDVVLELAGTEATSGVGELEGPQEVRGLEAQVGHGLRTTVKIHTCLKLGPAVIIS